MARDGVLTLFNIDDAVIWPITADTGMAYTLGSGIDVPGIQSISIGPEFLTKELFGDAQILDEYSKLRKVTGTVRHAQISLSVLAVLTGGFVDYGGSSPNEYAELIVSGSDLPSYFKMEGQCKYLGGSDAGGNGDAHFVLHKVKMSNFTVEPQSEEYAMVSFEFSGIATNFDGKILSIRENETAVALVPGAVDTTPPTVTSSVPADGATGISVSADLTFTFSESMQLSSMEAGSFFLVQDDGTAVAFAFSYDDSTDTATLNPTSNLSAASNYIAGVTTSARDLAGNKLAAQYVINFTTA